MIAAIKDSKIHEKTWLFWRLLPNKRVSMRFIPAQWERPLLFAVIDMFHRLQHGRPAARASHTRLPTPLPVQQKHRQQKANKSNLDTIVNHKKIYTNLF